MSHNDDDFQDRIQRILNEYKRKELAEKYEAQFSSDSNPNLPPEIEGQWLDHIAEFERQFEEASRISVREFVDSPVTRAVADIPVLEIEAELNHLLDILAEHNIFVDFLYEVEAEEAYRFIREELLDETIDDIRIPGLQHHFIYEEFHPNDEEDAKMWAEEFLTAFLSNDEEQLGVAVSDEELRDAGGEPVSAAQMHQLMARFHARHRSISDFTAKALACEVTGDQAKVEFALTWESSRRSTTDTIATIGRATIRLQRSRYGGWDVTQAVLPGI